MISNLLKMLSYPFMQRALVVGILVSLCAALLGVSLVLKRYSMIGDGLSHVGFGSLAIAKIEWSNWIKFMWKFLGVLMIGAIITVLVAVGIGF